MTCRVTEAECKRSTERRPRGFDITIFCSRFWQKNAIIPDDQVVRIPPKSLGGKRGTNGLEAKATTGGQAGETEPVWPSVAGQTVQDGGIIWTMQQTSNESLARVIDSVVWEVTDPDSTMVVDDDDIVNTGGLQQIVAYHSVGADGDETLVVAHVTFDDGSIEDFGILWTIHDEAE